MEDKSRYIISLSFGNYLKADGGVDKAIRDYQVLFNAIGVSYLHISPVLPGGRIGKFLSRKQNHLYTIVNNGEYVGIADEFDVWKYLAEYESENRDLVAIHIHHTKKFDIEFLIRILDSTNAPIYFFVHDYYSICEHPNLLRDGVKFCGVDCKDKTVCKGCKYAPLVEVHINNTVKLLEARKNVTIISPSDISMQIWKNTFSKYFTNLNYVVVPHQSCVGVNKNIPLPHEKMRIAFVGRLGENKGSEQWKRLVKFVNEKKLPYELYYLGFSDVELENVRNINVRVTANHPNQMLDTIKNMEINYVFLWSICPETYSYAYFEAFAANTYILTNVDSGNIAYLVQKYSNGKVFNNIDELLCELSESEKFKKRIKLFQETGIKGPLSYEANKNIIQLIGKGTTTVTWYDKGSKVNRYLKYIIEKLYLKKNRKE